MPQLYSLFYIYSPDKMSAIIYVDYWLCNKMQPKESLMWMSVKEQFKGRCACASARGYTRFAC